MLRKIARGMLCLSLLLLSGCVDLENHLDQLLYDNPEEIKEAQERRAVYATEQRNKNELQRMTKQEEELFALINEERTKAKVRVKGMNEPMQLCARVRAHELSQNFSAIRPNGLRFDTIKEDMTGVKPYWITSELRAYTYSFSARSILNEWMRKDKNREVIQRYGAHHYAVGVYYDGSKYYCVFLMGSG